MQDRYLFALSLFLIPVYIFAIFSTLLHTGQIDVISIIFLGVVTNSADNLYKRIKLKKDFERTSKTCKRPALFIA